jgi:hypothetical protein
VLEPASTALGVGTDDLEAQATQKRTWADSSSVGQSTPWDAGRKTPTNGQLVDAYG